MQVVVMILVLGVVIFVHELGHFIAAKAVGVQVLRFSIGFGPPILSWRRGETEYWIATIPLGGYVKMAGLEEEGDPTARLEGGPAAVAIDPARTLESKPVWARLIVMVAGVTMNVVLAYVIYTGVNVAGAPEPAIVPVDSVAIDQLPPAAGGLDALRPGDLIVRIDGDTVRTLSEFQRRLLDGPDTLRLLVAGRAEPVIVTLPRDQEERAAVARAIVPRFPPVVSIVLPGEPAHRAGMRPGDVIVRVNGDTVVSWGQLVATIRGSGGDTLRLDVLRGDERLHFVVVPKLRGDLGATQRGDTAWRIGANINAPMVYVAQPLGRAVVDGFRVTVERTGAVLVFLGRLVTGGVSVREVGGVVLIAQLTGQAAQLGFVQLIGFVAFISLNLAVINLLPIPVLDGGHVMFLLIEAVRGKPVSLGVRLRLTQVGFVLLLTLMVLAISNDVLRNLGR